jgi:[ribosomal protein S18]-alanine N-acetyltransferase
MNTRPHIRWMIRRDLPAALEIEQLSFEFPWTEGDFMRQLRQRNCIAMAAEAGEQVVGFMVYELHHDRVQLLNIAVHPSCWRRGIGVAMLDKLKSKLSPQRRTRISCEVRETNVAAQAWLRANGFRAVAIMRNFYEDTSEDAYAMRYRLAAASQAEPEAVRARIAE